MKEPKFSKVLAKYYIKWFQDCCESAAYCRERGDKRALWYLEDAKRYLTLIMENWEAIEFFSTGDNAFIRPSVLPKQFRDY